MTKDIINLEDMVFIKENNLKKDKIVRVLGQLLGGCCYSCCVNSKEWDVDEADKEIERLADNFGVGDLNLEIKKRYYRTYPITKEGKLEKRLYALDISAKDNEDLVINVRIANEFWSMGYLNEQPKKSGDKIWVFVAYREQEQRVGELKRYNQIMSILNDWGRKKKLGF